MSRAIIYPVACLLSLASFVSGQTVIYVDDDAQPGGDGLSWTTPYASVQDALDEADQNPAIAEIRVAQGTYEPGTSRTDAFQLLDELALRGGYRGLSGDGDPDDRDIEEFVTIFSGDIGVQGDPADNSYHVINGSGTTATAILDGFTISGGNANTSTAPHYVGGGMYNDQGSPTLTNCTFSANSATHSAGMYNANGHPTLTNCTFSGNSAGGHSGGMYNSECSPTLTDCTFIGNSAGGPSGGMRNYHSSPTLTNCAFVGNTAGEDGGGVVNTYYSSPIFTNCTFSQNSVGNNGGGMSNYYSSAPTLTGCTFSANSADVHGGGFFAETGTPTLTGCIFIGNTAGEDGGGLLITVASPALTNCIFSGNAATERGGGLYSFSSTPTLTNCTLSGNSAGISGGGMHNKDESYPTLTNCILWGNLAAPGAQVFHEGGTTTAAYCCIQGGWPGTGNISDDPLFVDADGADDLFGTPDDDLQLQAGSPCIDAGGNDAPGLDDVTTDLAGYPRIMDDPDSPDTGHPGASGPPIVDMGAYEFWPDCNANGVPDAIDIASGTSTDCNGNDIPDECDVADGVSEDCNQNGVPDECETFSTVLYVDDDAAGGLYDGSSWSNAYLDLADALYHADCSGSVTEIRVAAGVYRPSVQSEPGVSRTETFQLLNGVALRGGYRGLSGGGDPDHRDITLYETVLSGDLSGDDDPSDFPYGPSYEDNSYHVTTGNDTDTTAVIDGFTITGGSDDRSDALRAGGGMYNEDGSPTLASCLFKANWASWGGGLYNEDGNPTLVDCTFIGNQAHVGAGVYSEHATQVLTNCTFTGNSCTGQGGGMYADSSTSVLTDCTFSSNAAHDGGGACLDDGSATLTNCAFSQNSSIQGGGLYNYSCLTTMMNCTFGDNHARYGGGAFTHGIDTLTIINATLCNNNAEFFGGGVYRTSTGSLVCGNCIVWGNAGMGDPQIYGSDAPVSYSCVQGGWPGIGNIDSNPSLDSNYRLSVGSPCIDAGSNASVPADSLDLDGDGITTEPCPVDADRRPRFVDDEQTPDTGSGSPPIVDMGAGEFQILVYSADLDGDGDADLRDYAIFELQFTNGEPCPPETEADLDSDLDVDRYDFTLFVHRLTGPIP